jgi:hypothetical protein
MSTGVSGSKGCWLFFVSFHQLESIRPSTISARGKSGLDWGAFYLVAFSTGLEFGERSKKTICSAKLRTMDGIFAN